MTDPGFPRWETTRNRQRRGWSSCAPPRHVNAMNVRTYLGLVVIRDIGEALDLNGKRFASRLRAPYRVSPGLRGPPRFSGMFFFRTSFFVFHRGSIYSLRDAWSWNMQNNQLFTYSNKYSHSSCHFNYLKSHSWYISYVKFDVLIGNITSSVRPLYHFSR